MTPASHDDVTLSVSYRHEAIEHLAAALRRSNQLQALYVRHDLGRLLRLARRVLPPDHRLVAALDRRSYVPAGTPVDWTSSPRAMVAGRRGVVRFATVDQLGVRLDAAVARRLRARAPRLFIGLPYTSLYSFTAARTVGARTCLYVKGVRFLGEAVAGAADAVESLTIVGSGRDGFRALCASMPHARFVGQVAPGEVPRYHADADVLVHPSLSDSQSRVVLEGMASGLPVIITPRCGYEGIVDDGVQGFLVPPRDPRAIGERLRWLAGNGDRRVRMGRAARARAEEHAWPRFEARFLELLQSGWLT